MIDLKIDNRNDFYTPSVSFALDSEPIEDAEIVVTLGSMAPDKSGVIQGASEADPIVIETATPHGLATDDWVAVVRVVGNKGANGIWQVTVVDPTHFSLQESAATEEYISGGLWHKAIAGIINLPLERVNETLYKGTASEAVNLEQGVQYVSILDITNYGTHLEVPTMASYRTGA